MSDPLITYFENHPLIPEIDYKNPFHHAYLRELLDVLESQSTSRSRLILRQQAV